MSQNNLELNSLRFRLASVKNQKPIETESILKRACTQNTLEEIIDKKQKEIETTRYEFVKGAVFNAHLHKNRDKETVIILETIINMLRNIQDRLDVLEKGYVKYRN